MNLLVYFVCLQLMPYPCSETPDRGAHGNSWRRTDSTQRNPTNPSLLCRDQVTFEKPKKKKEKEEKCLFL